VCVSKLVCENRNHNILCLFTCTCKQVRANPDHFVIKHYAGNVAYDSLGMMEKNKDTMAEDVVILIAQSKFLFLKEIFPAVAGDRKATVATQFQKQLGDLMSTLNSTTPHYVRCVKPNPNKQPEEFVASMVLEQLRYSGVLEAVQIRKQGFPFRLTHADFNKQFRCVAPEHVLGIKDHKKCCQILIDAMDLDQEHIQLGFSKVLYRSHIHRILELKRNVAVEKTVIYLQARLRSYRARKLKNLLKKAKVIFETAMKVQYMSHDTYLFQNGTFVSVFVIHDVNVLHIYFS
jgi:myosin heavy subunit